MYEVRRGGFRWQGRVWAIGAGGCVVAAVAIVGGVAPPGEGTGDKAREPQPAALLAGESIDWSELRGRLAEAAGAIVLEESLLDRLAAREMKDRGLTLEKGAAEREAVLLADSVARTAGVSTADERLRLIDAVRRSRGLGESRYRAMLTRNAMLRRLVRDEVKIGDDDLQQAFAIRYGPKYRVRVIVVPEQARAAAVRARVVGAEGKAAEAFGEVAAEVSTDQSRFRGGAVDPLSTADPTYPAGLRQIVGGLEVGQVSQPVAVDGGFAIVRLEEKIPPSGITLREVAEEVRGEMRLVRERVMMDRLANRLLAGASVTVLDPSLAWSWRSREQGRSP